MCFFSSIFISITNRALEIKRKMAESVVAQPPQRFYCHKCNVEIENVSSVSSCAAKQQKNNKEKMCLSKQWKYDDYMHFFLLNVYDKMMFFFHKYFRNSHVHCVLAVLLKNCHQMDRMNGVAAPAAMTT